ncbi:hypothetical protein AAC387_Pa03g2508 [Persea americana]
MGPTGRGDRAAGVGSLRRFWFPGGFCRSLDLGEEGGLETGALETGALGLRSAWVEGALDMGLAWVGWTLDMGLAWVSGRDMEGEGFRVAGGSMRSESITSNFHVQDFQSFP